MRPRTSPAVGPAISVVLAAGAVWAAAAGTHAVLERRVGIGALLEDWQVMLLAGLLLLSLALCTAAGVASVATAVRAELPGRPTVELGAAVVIAVVGWQAFLLLAQPFQRIWFDAAAATAAGVWAGFALWVRGRPAAPRARRAVRAACAVALGVALATFGAELALRAASALAPSQLLARSSQAPRRLIERFRCRPGQARFGFPCNSSGHYDEEFFRSAPGERLVCSIGDSFNLGSVPHSRHFTTVCEEELGLPVHNLGVAGIGPSEYLALLLDEALPLAPAAVVVDLFVGNDLGTPDVERDLPDALLRDWFQRERALTWVVSRRLARIARERARLQQRRRGVAIVQGERAVLERFPWLDDPSLEQGTLAEETFLRLETDRARAVCGEDPASLPSVFESLTRMREACGPIPLGVMLIPDEFQVEDPLWAAVEAEAGVPLERDRPQRLLRTWLDEQGIPALDLLAELRAVRPGEDGRRHLYHLHDTHFNARGNAVAGRALARFLGTLLEP
ncbi:MAG: hypothetical protein QF903_02335 [Planctomycetota bacterium]|nr:hypothetical protein [Planctomycetota bacterium]MDP6988298.1 hypothetical protein [Planctomycetota bacterium]